MVTLPLAVADTKFKGSTTAINHLFTVQFVDLQLSLWKSRILKIWLRMIYQYRVTKEADKENHTLTMSNVRVTSNMKCRVILSELPVNIVEQKKKLEAQQNKKSTNKPKTSDGHKKIISHHEDPMPEACAVTAKQGTLKYLKQREKYVEATAKEAHVDQDFFLDKIGLTPKKSKVSQLLMPGSMDDSLTITTPKSSTSTSDGDALDTPRVHLMGMLGGYTPTSDTPTTPASETKRDALVLVYHHLHANKGKPRGVRKSLQMSQSSSTVIPEQPHKKLTPLEINTLLGHQEGCNNDSSVDEYFEDITDVPSPVW
ncbi:hypothetical protein Pmani_033597 [Petrolisthes manimaculis]|uniref:Uncharacterized protein n=1 Tax=Petrolisthes manimaculis TaxID=1843537 RepID=A0AAE1NP35_9EUCA|nr:hypothetical protein Pmani_033597 [Petrolisthes manimaculis]